MSGVETTIRDSSNAPRPEAGKKRKPQQTPGLSLQTYANH
jgi:hypothetical protein